jgi:Protein of unknown function (DUF2510)
MYTVRSPGWYPDPFNIGKERRWDGSRWTTDVRTGARGATAWAKKSATEATAKVSEKAKDAQVEKVVTTTCSSCGAHQEVVIGGGAEGALRRAGVVLGAVTLGTTGFVVGTGIGIASGGTAHAGTVPLTAAGAVGGALAGDRAGEAVANFLRSRKCSECREPLVVTRSRV